MTSENPTPSMQERMADLKETLKKEKVKLTPEVELYIQEHVRALQDKLQNGEDVYEEDLTFIDEVKLWVDMPEEWRLKYVSIEEMQGSEEQAEAKKRHISLKQWLDVLHVAKAADKSRKWLDETFTFPGGGKIEVEGDLDLRGCTGLTTLPEGLEVGGGLYLNLCTGLTTLPEGLEVGGGLYLSFCTGLTTLPEGLKVGRSLYLNGCTALTTLPEGLRIGGGLYLNLCTGLTTLPEGLKVGGGLNLSFCTGLTTLPEGLKVGGDLFLNGCTRLTSLPEGLEVEGYLFLNGCTGLTSLPEGLEVEGDLFLSEHLHEQVKKDAERLKQEGRIGGEIRYM